MGEIYPHFQFEKNRLEELEKYRIMDTPPEQAYDDLILLASQVCRAPIAFISFLEHDRQWFKARLGMDAEETTREIAFCRYTIQGNNPLIIPDATLDVRFNQSPLVIEEPKIRFYAGLPLITPNGHRIGALCVADRAPRNLSREQQFALEVLSRQVVQQLELRLRNEHLQQALDKLEVHHQEAQEARAISQRLLSVISHDLSGPIATIKGFFDLIRQERLSSDETRLFITQISQLLSSTETLLRNMVVWVRAQLQKEVNATTTFSLYALVEEVISNIKKTVADKHNSFFNETPDYLVTADRQQVMFVLRNLIHNANKYTEQGSIRVVSNVEQGMIKISITDSGIGMSPTQLASLLHWKSRLGTPGTAGEKGNGLGLLITYEFLRQMGGTLFAESQEGHGSTFYLTFPSHDSNAVSETMVPRPRNGIT
ncbi:MAG: GAF domain-containing sensor histidine kinase [Cyclobacteriaceae bacterium]